MTANTYATDETTTTMTREYAVTRTCYTTFAGESSYQAATSSVVTINVG
jgi:hypothetical protein